MPRWFLYPGTKAVLCTLKQYAGNTKRTSGGTHSGNCALSPVFQSSNTTLKQQKGHNKLTEQYC